MINIGDAADVRKRLEKAVRIEVNEDVMTASLLERLSRADSPINMLMGGKTFIEGWSRWRVSSVGPLRLGKGQGSQAPAVFAWPGSGSSRCREIE
jgi:hypothetical protein